MSVVFSMISVECKARFPHKNVAADQEVEVEVYLRVRCPFPVKFYKISVSLNNPVRRMLSLPPAIKALGGRVYTNHSVSVRPSVSPYVL